MDKSLVIYENINPTENNLYLLKKYQTENYSGINVTAHFHFMYELMWFDQSVGYFGISDRQFMVRSGTLVFIPALQVHTLFLNPGDRHQRYLLQFEEGFPATLSVTSFFQHKDQVLILYPDDVTRQQLSSLFDWASTYASNPLQRNLLYKTLSLLIEQVFSLPSPSLALAQPVAGGLINKIHRILNNSEKTQRWLTTRQASLSCAVSESCFSRHFKRVFNMTFKEYVFRRKINQAIRLLLSTRHSIAEVAQSAGFTDSAYFCLRFRQQFGCTPQQFRRQQQIAGKFYSPAPDKTADKQ
mgnify:FL=1